MMMSLFLAIVLLQRPGALQPGTGIVTGSVQSENYAPAAAVRVGAMAVDDPSSLVSVAETDGAGRFRLTNIPEGQYFIVAGRLDNLSYYPGGTDRSKANTVMVEAAKVTTIGSFTVPAGSTRPVAPTISTYPVERETIAFAQIANTKNPDAKKRLLLDFEKGFPRSNRLAEALIELSRVFASQNDFYKANEYADKAVAAVNRLKKETPATFTANWQNWVASLDASAKNNLAWVKQMSAWQQKGVNSTVLGRR
jgi:hypothetical protein